MARLTLYRPFRDIWNTRSWIDRWFEQALAPFSDPFALWGDWFSWSVPSWAAFPGDNLALDLYETDKELIAEVPLPGVKPEDVHIEERDGVLTIRAESKGEDERTYGQWRLRERRYGAWQRSVRLPYAVRSDKAKAELKDGILTITLPKAESARPGRRIAVSLPKVKLPALGRKEKRIKVRA